MYRERRDLYGTQVLHWVCEECGHAVPAIQRTPSEHQRAVQEGAIRPALVHHAPAMRAGVVAIRTRRAPHHAAAWRRASSG